MELFKKMSLFGKLLTYRQQEHLLLAALFNDLRLLEEDRHIRRVRALKMLKAHQRTLSTVFDKVTVELPVREENWWQHIANAYERLADIPAATPVEKLLALNLWLFRSGLCPFVCFAFNQWHEPKARTTKDTKTLLENIAELSTTFLYRLIAIKEEYTTQDLLGTGAYSNVYASDDKQSIYKVPRNLASRCFASDEEFHASMLALNTGLASYVPKLLSYDKTTGIIQREFVPGYTGATLLKQAKFLNRPFGLEQLKHIYSSACEIWETTGVNFDIHPGNLIWNSAYKHWMIVDLGPMPTIGADYFPRDGFNKYFQKIWLDRYELIANVPIRSVDIDIAPSHIVLSKVPEKMLINIG